jgi:hypothetical protein
MHIRRWLAAAVWLTILLGTQAYAKDKHPGAGRGHGSHASLRHQVPASASVQALYSPRALRRARMILQMRLLELREARLNCLRAALQRRLPADLTDRAAALARSANDCSAATR